MADLDPAQMEENEKKMMTLIRNIYDLTGTDVPGHEYEMLRDYYAMMQLLVTVYRQEEADDLLYRSSKALQRLSPITEYIKKALCGGYFPTVFGGAIWLFHRTFIPYVPKNTPRINYKSYLSGIRVEHAVEEMEKGDKTISEIATQVGFSDSRALAKAFQKKYGMLPSEYNRKNRGKCQKIDMYQSSIKSRKIISFDTIRM